MKKIIAALSICAVGAVTVCSMQDNVKAENLEDGVIPQPVRSEYALTTGDVNALVVRIGFKDYPADNTNPLYSFYNDEYLRSFYEGKAEGFKLPYNGLSDYLKTSSYGVMSINIGEIIDIQMDEPMDYYCDEYGVCNFYSNSEFIEKLYDKIDDISKYDRDGDNQADALYIWNLCNSTPEHNAAYTWHPDYVFMQIPSSERENDEYILNVLIHETGHLLLNLYDYYLFNYPQDGRIDIGNIMSWVMYGTAGDYDGWSKYIAEWLTTENVIYKTLTDGNHGEISLSPYDSDTSEGKKIAILKYSDSKYIAIDYCGGINNNDLDTELRKKGFRFYKVDAGHLMDVFHNNKPELAPEGDYVTPYEELGDYELFAEGDVIEDIFPLDDYLTLKVFDIKTGTEPSFKYSFSNAEESSYEDTVQSDESAENPYSQTESSINKLPEELSESDSKNVNNDLNDLSDNNKNNPKINNTKEPSNKSDVKQPVTASPNSSGNVSKVSAVMPNANTPQTQVVTATNKTAPQTGYNSNMQLWITIVGVSAGVLATAVIAKRKKKI